MKNNKKFDSLYVINANTNLNILKIHIQSTNYLNVLILSTNLLFENEIKPLKTIGKCKISFTSFYNHLTDTESENIDNIASQKFYINIDKVGYCNYDFDDYMNHLTFLKNEFIHKKLVIKYHHFKNIYYHSEHIPLNNLGIDQSYWKSIGGKPLKSQNIFLLFKSRLSNIFKFVKKVIYFSQYIFKPQTIKIVEDNSTIYIFIHGLRKLKLSKSAKIESAKIYYLKYFGKLFSSNRQETIILNFYNKYLNQLQKRKGKKIKICVPFHLFKYNYYKYFNSEIYLFQESYIPSNFSISKLIPFPIGSFVIWDFFSKKYFQKYNRKTSSMPLFIDTPKIEFEKFSFNKVSTIIWFGQSGGDWSALINRSDTDIMVKNIVKMAREFPKLKFILRPHPWMTDARHDGLNSLLRIKNWVRQLNLSNLEVSNLTLDQDIERGDVFLTEYSTAILESLKFGKLAIILNFTNRRSFMYDFIDLGFINVKNNDQFKELLIALQNDLHSFERTQKEATQKYIKLQQQFF